MGVQRRYKVQKEKYVISEENKQLLKTVLRSYESYHHIANKQKTVQNQVLQKIRKLRKLFNLEYSIRTSKKMNYYVNEWS